MMELPLVLSVYHFWVGFEPIFEFGFFPLVFYIMGQKIRDAFSRHFSDLTKKEKWSKIVSKT